MGFTVTEIVDYIQRAIDQRTGDNLERAQSAFRGLADDQMDKEYGQSGKTRREILNGYECERTLATAAMKWVCDRQ